MKKLLLLLLLPFIIYGQPEHTAELRIELINHGSFWDVTIKLTAISARWDENYELTENYEIAYVYLTSGHEDPQTLADFDHILDPNAGVNPIFAVGIYKISAIENNVEQAYFYCDWRTSDWRSSLDVYFKYDVGNKRFRDWGNTQTINYSYQTLWNLTGNLLKTDGLEDYWNNCLAVFNNGNDHPKFAWGPYPVNLGIYEYRIYRNYGGWELLATLDNDEFTYVDEVFINPPGGQAGTDVYYYVKGVYTENPPSQIETTASNTVVVNVPGKDIDKNSVSNTIGLNNEYYLSQNYPNPINPSTIINYSLPVSRHVTLKVFDILGREVAELVNEQKESGTHAVVFDASNLMSGIYFYQIRAGKYTETRKLILQK